MDDFQTVFELIGVLARQRYVAAEHSFGTLGFNHTEARLLRLLSEQAGESTQDALSARMTLDRSNAGRALQRLEDSGYLTRARSGTDKRRNLVQLTESGRLAVVELGKLRQALIQEFCGGLSPADARTLVELLRKVVQHG